MALIREYFAAIDSYGITGTLLDTTTATTDGEWMDLQGYFPLGFTVEGAYTGAVQLCVSNQPTRPANSEHGAPLGSPVGANGGTRTLDQAYRWGKARVTSFTPDSGSVRVFPFGSPIPRRA